MELKSKIWIYRFSTPITLSSTKGNVKHFEEDNFVYLVAVYDPYSKSDIIIVDTDKNIFKWNIDNAKNYMQSFSQLRNKDVFKNQGFGPEEIERDLIKFLKIEKILW